MLLSMANSTSTTSKQGNKHLKYYGLLLVGAIGGMMLFSSVPGEPFKETSSHAGSHANRCCATASYLH